MDWLEARADALPFPEEIHKGLADRLARYFTLLSHWSRAINLTRIRTLDSFLRQCNDALAIVEKISKLTGLQPAGVVDIGSGAGFPGIPMKLIVPGLRLTLLEPRQKRVAFLHRVRAELGLEELAILHMRAENAAETPQLSTHFDVATCKALGRLDVEVALAFPLLHRGGYLIAAKGEPRAEELEAGRKKAEEWSGGIVEVDPPLGVPLEDRCRLIVVRRG